MEKIKKLAEISVLLPIAHLVVCAIFLSGYGICFGGNVNSLFSIADIFSVTLSDVMPAYIFGLFIPTALGLISNGHFEKEESTLLSSEFSQDKIDEYYKNRENYRKIIYSGIALGSILILSISFYRYYNNKYINLGAIIPALFILLLPTWIKIPLIDNLENKDRVVITCFVSFIISSFSSGMQSGSIDRRESYKFFENDRYYCKKLFIIRPFSGKYIAIDEKNSRYIIDEKCEVVFNFPPRKPFS